MDESFFTISPEALKKIQAQHEDASNGWLLAVEPKSPTKGVYTLRPLKDDDTEQMQRFQKEGIVFWMDFSLLPFLEGTEIQLDEDTGEIEVVNEGLGIGTVSYTHLTLPTKRIV